MAPTTLLTAVLAELQCSALQLPEALVQTVQRLQKASLWLMQRLLTTALE
jgi:hypothetical protein